MPVMGSSSANRLPQGTHLGRGRLFWAFTLAELGLPHESGAIEGIPCQLPRSERCFIVHSTPEEPMFRECSLIWEMQAKVLGREF